MRNTPVDVCVQKATAGDAAALAELVCALADYEQLPRPEPAALERLARDAFGPAPRFDTWLARADGRAVGYAITFFTYSTFLAMPTLYLEDLFVLPDYRSLGIGKRLFLACAQYGYERGCGRMEWQVLNWNAPAIAFYQRMGARHMAEWQPFRMTRDQMGALIGDLPGGQPLTRR